MVRPCSSGESNIRAQSLIEPGRDQGPHRQGVVGSFSGPRRLPPQHEDEDAEHFRGSSLRELGAFERGA